MGFVDGENLVCRYQEMLRNGKKKNAHEHIEDVFVWHSNMGTIRPNLVRVNYYTSAIASTDVIDEYREKIGACIVRSPIGKVRLSAHVFKKPAATKKSKLIDITLTIDALHHAYGNHVDTVVIFSGDGDYVPLVKEIMRTGKQVVVAAVSSGLSPELRRIADQFYDLDEWLFAPS